MKGIAIMSPKGGVGKTSLSHLLALGAAWQGIPAYLMHTDNRNPITVNGRPYMYYDARDPETLSRLIGAAINQDGLCIIDSGGNRPDFDTWIASSVDMILIPVTPDPESVSMAVEHLNYMKKCGAKHVKFILNMVSSNKYEKKRDGEQYFNNLHPDSVIGKLSKVSAIKRLRENDSHPFCTPPTNVNNLAKQFYFMIKNII